MEVWKPVPGFGNHYEASSLGRIRSLDRIVVKRHTSGVMMEQKYPGKILSPTKERKYGHLYVHLGYKNKKIQMAVHRLVLMAFIGLPPENQEACHNNGIAYDNRIENLRWDTHANNNKDRQRHGTYPTGENHPMAKLNWDTIKDIRSGLGFREAREKYGVSSSNHWRIIKNLIWVQND